MLPFRVKSSAGGRKTFDGASPPLFASTSRGIALDGIVLDSIEAAHRFGHLHRVYRPGRLDRRTGRVGTLEAWPIHHRGDVREVKLNGCPKPGSPS